MNRNLTVKMGDCHHRRYLPWGVTLTRSGAVDPANVLTRVKEGTSAIDAYQSLDRHAEGWIKVELRPGSRSKEVGGPGQVARPWSCPRRRGIG